MKIFYACFAGTHSSVIAGYIHLKRLPADRIPRVAEIMAVKEFDSRSKKECGSPYYLGRDEADNEVFVIGLGKDRALGFQTIYYFLEERDRLAEWKFFDTLAEINLLTRVGGFLSGNLKFKRLGRYLAALGIQKCYRRLVRLVERIKERDSV